MLNLYQIPLKQVQGVRGKKPDDLLALGISNVGELLDYYPFRYEDYTIRDLTEVKDGDRITVQGTIVGVPQVHMYGRIKSRLTCKIVVDPMFITAVWFNRHYMKDQLKAGLDIVLTGKWDQKRLHLTVSESEIPGKGTTLTGTLQPVYSVAGPESRLSSCFICPVR
jgi:ATP-dependent DNA helicase RecG